MKKVLILLIHVFLLSHSNLLKAQSPHCSEIVNTVTTYNTTDPNFWDWKAPVWQTNIYSTLSGQVNSIVSPFYTIPTNLDNYSNSNILLLVQNADKDFKPEEGWELLTKNLGTSSSPPIANGYAIFYNKFTSKIRAFFLITQLFSSSLSNDVTQGGIVKIYFENQYNFTLRQVEPYQSNLLTSFTSPLQGLDNFSRNLSMSVANEFRNNIPYWLYADFPVAYDPCTCQNRGTITIDTNLVTEGQINLTINSQAYQSPISANKVNKSTDFRQNFTDFSGDVGSSLKAAADGGEALSKINDVISKQANVDIRNKLAQTFGVLSNDVNSIGSWLSLIPLAGTAVNSLLSIFDSFNGGGSSSKGPAPVLILNDFKATGTIKSTSGTNKATFPLPGSDQTGKALSGRPVYNNTLGVFNFLYKPEVVMNYSDQSQVLVAEDICYENSSQRFISHSVTTTSTPTQLLISNNPKNLKFAVNPALNIDLSKSDIRCAYVIEGCDYQFYSNTNLIVDLEKGGNPVYRSSYHPIGNFRNNEAVPIFSLNTITTVDNPNCPFIMDNIVSTSNCTPNVFIKVVARLRRQNNTNPNEDIIFIGKYPVSVSGAFNNFMAGGVQNLTEDIQLPTAQPINAAQNQWSAQNSIVSSSFSNPTNAPIFLSAGGSVTATAGSSFVSGSKLSISNIYPNSAALTASLKATSSDLNTFCGGPVYQNPTRYQNARVAAENQDESFQIEQAFSAFPNPATDNVVFRYFVQDRTRVQIKIVNLNGQVVSIPVDTENEFGIYEVKFDASQLAAGVYLYTLETSKGKETKRLVVIK